MNNKMRFIIIWGVLLSGAINAIAQQPPDFSAKKAAGLITYNPETVLRKLKIENEQTIKAVITALEQYNMQIYQLSDTHNATLQELDEYFSRQVKIAMQRRERSQMDGVKLKISETIPPIRQEVNKHEIDLNEAMKSTLEAKQFNKWLKYQDNKKPNVPANMSR